MSAVGVKNAVILSEKWCAKNIHLFFGPTYPSDESQH